MVILVKLPVGPSANAMYFFGAHGQRFRKKPYMEWLDAAVYLIKKQASEANGAFEFYDAETKEGGYQVPVYIDLTIMGGKGFPRSRDCDNALKAVVDAVELAGIIANDNCQHVHQVQSRYYPPDYHLKWLGDKRPSRKADLEAAFYVRIQDVVYAGQ